MRKGKKGSKLVIARATRRLASVEESGAAQDGVAEAAEVAALERPPGALEHGAARGGGAARQDLALLHRRVGWATGGGSARRRPCCCAVIGRSGWLFCSLVLSVDDICKTVPRWV
jgi:hypothetical protein